MNPNAFPEEISVSMDTWRAMPKTHAMMKAWAMRKKYTSQESDGMVLPARLPYYGEKNRICRVTGELCAEVMVVEQSFWDEIVKLKETQERLQSSVNS